MPWAVCKVTGVKDVKCLLKLPDLHRSARFDSLFLLTWKEHIQKHDGKYEQSVVKCMSQLYLDLRWSCCSATVSEDPHGRYAKYCRHQAWTQTQGLHREGVRDRQRDVCREVHWSAILKPFGWTLQVDRFKDVGTVLTVLQLRIWHLVSEYVKGFEAIAVLWRLQILSLMCRTSPI